MTEKEQRLKKEVTEMLTDSLDKMKEKIDKAFKSGCIDVEGWDEGLGRLILPKTITAAIIEDEVSQYLGRNTSFERQVRKEVDNIKCFI
tara:strand:+ start:719 stop:985 length:267 start_codon:yes stop_codon:yes gene_type:complete